MSSIPKDEILQIFIVVTQKTYFLSCVTIFFQGCDMYDILIKIWYLENTIIMSRENKR